MSFYTSASRLIIASLYSVLGTENAYLDPGSGSFILQLILASLLGGLLLLKTYWKKISNFFRGKSPNGNDDEDE
jgi:hypothetical protein